MARQLEFARGYISYISWDWFTKSTCDLNHGNDEGWLLVAMVISELFVVDFFQTRNKQVHLL